MKFLDPSVAVWLLAAPLAVLFAFFRARSRRRFQTGLSMNPALFRLSRLTGRRRDAVVIAAALFAVMLPALAAMRPRVRQEVREPDIEKHDLVLVLDRSASMRARDIPPSRLLRALDEIREFLVAKPAAIDRVALVAFSGTALTVSHLTRDVPSLLFFLDWLRDDATVYFGTDVAASLETALAVIERDGAARRPIFVLVSDGDDHGARLEEKLEELRGAGIRLHCIGIGSDRTMTIPATLDGTGLLEDEEGRPLTTQFDSASLRRMATATGGRYVSSVTGRDLAAALRAIVAAENRQLGWKVRQDERDAHRPLLLAAAAAVVLLMVTT